MKYAWNCCIIKTKNNLYNHIIIVTDEGGEVVRFREILTRSKMHPAFIDKYAENVVDEVVKKNLEIVFKKSWMQRLCDCF